MNRKLKAVIIDLYDNEPNQGMRCIQDILKTTDGKFENVDLEYDIYEARYKGDVPGMEYDIYISSGGPGSPFDGEGKQWEKEYFELLDNIMAHNAECEEHERKHVLFICHSFQIMARYYKFAEVLPRKSTSFGVMPVHKTEVGKKDELFDKLPDIFYGADFREFQVIQPNEQLISDKGYKVLCIEKERPHVPLERAIMAVRISDEIVGTQFHPEADPESMYYHFKKPERKEQVVGKHGEKKYFDMLALLENPKAIPLTHDTVIPNFLRNAVFKMCPEARGIKAS